MSAERREICRFVNDVLLYFEKEAIWTFDSKGELLLTIMFSLAQEESRSISENVTWGRRHLRWLKQNRRVTYTNLLTTGRLYDYLRDIDTQASEQLELLIRQMAKAEGITEQLKAEDQMEWVRRMNGIRNRAEEIINRGLIYC